MSFQDFVDGKESNQKEGADKRKLIIAALVIAALIGAAFFFFVPHDAAQSEVSIQRNEDGGDNVGQEMHGNETGNIESLEPERICVHIGGCVLNPGICYLEQGARVADAVEAAGGMSEDAAVDAINLAKVLSDGEQIIVQSKDGLAQQQAAATTADSTGADNASQSQAAQTSSGKININTASVSELQTISGIGQSKAEKIIAYREKSGPFKSVDDLINVSGIGEKTLESIKEYICV